MGVREVGRLVVYLLHGLQSFDRSREFFSLSGTILS